MLSFMASLTGRWSTPGQTDGWRQEGDERLQRRDAERKRRRRRRRRFPNPGLQGGRSWRGRAVLWQGAKTHEAADFMQEMQAVNECCAAVGWSGGRARSWPQLSLIYIMGFNIQEVHIQRHILAFLYWFSLWLLSVFSSLDMKLATVGIWILELTDSISLHFDQQPMLLPNRWGRDKSHS